MTSTQFASVVRYKTRTNATTFTDAEILLLMNIFKDEISSLIVERNAGYFLIPSTFDLVASSTSREYGFDDTQLSRMHKLELKFTSTDSRQPARYIKDYQGSETESEIVKNFSNAKDQFAYTIRRRAMLILSGTIIAVVGGGRLWWHKYPEDFTVLNGSTDMSVDPSTTTFGFPRQFHELLARRISIEYKGRQPKPIPLSDKEKNYDNDLERQLEAVATVDNSGEIIGDFPGPTDKLMGNNGFKF